MMPFKIALDGPSGAGKSSLAKKIAKELGIVYVDTGALYRTIGLYVKEHNISPEEPEKVAAALKDVKLQLLFENGEQVIRLCGKKIGDEIRSPEMSMYASKVSAIPEVRTFLLDTQRNIAKENSVIMDGRDIGTVIFPDAEVKIFLCASHLSRAQRRAAELREKGINVSVEEVLKDMEERDKNDSQRAIAPAVPAKDAVILDNSDINLDQTVAAALDIIKSKISLSE
ncbi:MAG: (d)CMP kinase [Clostridia bacterium]|nr:(d)CMP kinase [Clostridia bacterium]